MSGVVMRIILAGCIGRFPLAGHGWITSQYLLGLQSLGHQALVELVFGEIAVEVSEVRVAAAVERVAVPVHVRDDPQVGVVDDVARARPDRGRLAVPVVLPPGPHGLSGATYAIVRGLSRQFLG